MRHAPLDSGASQRRECLCDEAGCGKTGPRPVLRGRCGGPDLTNDHPEQAIESIQLGARLLRL